ncbi:MAG: type II toxin-antitoxin system RelE/ParE family toxin [Nitrospirae bacterium]|nr:type II toxin-antitoxin system RelE/ParE family toxin [Nitrospirota bacterium]
MNYCVRIERDAYKALSTIQRNDRVKIAEAIDLLKEQPESGKLLYGKWKNLRSLRVGDYRIVYSIIETDMAILVVRIGHRKDIYRF